ncbi:ankyrin repeat-containing domain protein [Bipolaris maydis]|nr:ankyrin repeat-containing domain protein [Bipolaris maydis]
MGELATITIPWRYRGAEQTAAQPIVCYKPVVRLLLARGANINPRDRSPLKAAASEGHEDVVKLLLDKGANIEAKEEDGNALIFASARGHEKVVKILLDSGANINAEVGYYGNALCAASAEGCEEVVKLLLDRGADINAKAGSYSSILSLALAYDCHKIVDLLRKRGAQDCRQVAKRPSDVFSYYFSSSDALSSSSYCSCSISVLCPSSPYPSN